MQRKSQAEAKQISQESAAKAAAEQKVLNALESESRLLSTSLQLQDAC